MKNLLLLFFLALSFSLQAQEDEKAAITETLNNYLIGGTERDAEGVVSAFYPTAQMQYIKDGEFVSVNAGDFFAKTKPGPRQDRETHILNIDVQGHAASAILRIDYPTFSFHDYMQLLKINDKWWIVSKIFYREMKEEKG